MFKFLLLIIIQIFLLPSCSSPGYSDNIRERLGQVMEDERNPKNKERRKFLYTHRNDSCEQIEDLYFNKKSNVHVPSRYILNLAKQNHCNGIISKIEHDIMVKKQLSNPKVDPRIHHDFEEYITNFYNNSQE